VNKLTAYYSLELKSWVRMEGPQEDGEYCLTSGYQTRAEAMGFELNKMNVPLWDAHGMPAFLTENA